METKTVPGPDQEVRTPETIDQRVQKLYQTSIGIKNELADSSFRTRFSRRIKGYDAYNRQHDLRDVEKEIYDLLRRRPGEYPLNDLKFIMGIGGAGFDWSYEYKIGDDTFRPSFWAYNRWGVVVQRHDANYQPTLEILPEFNKKVFSNNILHLPEGYEIPVGPLHMEDDDVPASKEQYQTDQREAEEMARMIGIKVNLKLRADADRLMGSPREYTPRYFRWKPVLSEKPTRIAIDFAKIRATDMAIREEDAPVYEDARVLERPF
jgi:hypothetical protein